jgi:hypothetical protein
MHGTPNIPILMVVIFILIICVILDTARRRTWMGFCTNILYGEKKYLYESKKQRQEIIDIEYCLINQLLICRRYCIPLKYYMWGLACRLNFKGNN